MNKILRGILDYLSVVLIFGGLLWILVLIEFIRGDNIFIIYLLLLAVAMVFSMFFILSVREDRIPALVISAIFLLIGIILSFNLEPFALISTFEYVVYYFMKVLPIAVPFFILISLIRPLYVWKEILIWSTYLYFVLSIIAVIMILYNALPDASFDLNFLKTISVVLIWLIIVPSYNLIRAIKSRTSFINVIL